MIFITHKILFRVIKSRRMRWTGHVARMEVRRRAYMVLVGKPEGRRPLGRPMGRWYENIKMDLQEMEWGAWAELIWLRTGTAGDLL
jgi:hypothetical protein